MDIEDLLLKPLNGSILSDISTFFQDSNIYHVFIFGSIGTVIIIIMCIPCVSAVLPHVLPYASYVVATTLCVMDYHRVVVAQQPDSSPSHTSSRQKEAQEYDQAFWTTPTNRVNTSTTRA